jgi:hypothetical protein
MLCASNEGRPKDARTYQNPAAPAAAAHAELRLFARPCIADFCVEVVYVHSWVCTVRACRNYVLSVHPAFFHFLK